MPSKPTIYFRCKHLCPLMENESRKWWQDWRGKGWKKKASRGSGRHIWVQSASWRCIGFTDSVPRNPLLIRMILMSFQCFLFIWFAFSFFQINFYKSNMRKYCWLMSYRYKTQLARKTWTGMPPGKPLKQTRNERGAQTGSHVDIRLPRDSLEGLSLWNGDREVHMTCDYVISILAIMPLLKVSR